ncbi:MAG: hypothetical protein ACKV2Q_21770 [Planctomycetaceae bacterium]
MQNSRWWNAVVGGVSGLTLVAGVSQFWLNAGTSLPSQTALLATLLAVLIVNAVMPTRWRTGLLSQAVQLFVMSAWTAMLPSLFVIAWSLIEATSVDLSRSLIAQWGGLTAMAFATLSVPMLCALGLNSTGRQTVFGISLALSVGIGGIGLATFIGPDGCGLFAATCGLIAFVAAMIVHSRSHAPSEIPRSHAPRGNEKAEHGNEKVVALLAVGLLWVLGQRLVRQLVPDSFALMTMEWGTLIAGVTIGRALARDDRRGGLMACALGLSGWIWLCLALFPLGVRLALWENATISQVWLLQSVRLTIVGLVLGPIGLSAGVLIGRNSSAVAIAAALVSTMVAGWLLPMVGVWGFALMATSVLLGVAVWSKTLSADGKWKMENGKWQIRSEANGLSNAMGEQVHCSDRLDALRTTAGSNFQSAIRHLQSAIRNSASAIRHLPSVICGLPSAIRHLLSAIRHLPSAICNRLNDVTRPRRITLKTLRQIVIATTLLFTVSAPAWVRYRPELPAKVLFDTSVFVASRGQVPWEQLPVLDEGRAAFVVEGDRGTLTAWKFSGSRFLVRENGVPKGTLATNVELAPRFVPDVLPTVLPLVTHERPQSLLLLGLRAGEPAAIATMFPLRRIVCVEADRSVLALSRSLLSSGDDGSSLTDDRLEMRVCDPALAVRTMPERFDVIVASTDQPSLPQSANGFTVESLRAAADRLNDEGVFALRFQHIDFGPRSVRVLAKTMSAAFREVAAVEITPGELLFLGTNSERGFAREGFVERWQRPQVRRLLASVGWDWSTPLRLPMLSHEALQELVARSGAVVNVASRSTWPFRLPTEVMRWDNKLQQVQAELIPHERFLMVWGGDEANSADVAARLSEWELSRAIIRRHSDEFWAYRKSVKEHMTSSPRAMIQQAGHSAGDSDLHADDRQRLSYFRTIGELAKNTQLTEADFDRLRRFESPFDPLVSPFLHQELVEMMPRCSERDAVAELHHRLAAIYFTTPADRSIRNVADALQFVNSTPTAIPDPVERFDQLNGLLQMLLARWTARGEFRPTSSRVALNDIERSIAATETTFVTLKTLAAQGVVPVEEWQARQQHLERRLVRPLRTYRGQVLQHYVKIERTKEVIDQSDTLKTPPE